MKQKIYIAALLAGMLALAGCGGGGGSAEPVVNDPPLSQADCDAGTIFSEGACLTQEQIAAATAQAEAQAKAMYLASQKTAIAGAGDAAAVDKIIAALDNDKLTAAGLSELQSDATQRKEGIARGIANRQKETDRDNQNDALTRASGALATAISDAQDAGNAVDQTLIDAVTTARDTLQTAITEATEVEDTSKYAGEVTSATSEIKSLGTRLSEVTGLEAANTRLSNALTAALAAGEAVTEAMVMEIKNAHTALDGLIKGATLAVITSYQTDHAAAVGQLALVEANKRAGDRQVALDDAEEARETAQKGELTTADNALSDALNAALTGDAEDVTEAMVTAITAARADLEEALRRAVDVSDEDKAQYRRKVEDSSLKLATVQARREIAKAAEEARKAIETLENAAKRADAASLKAALDVDSFPFSKPTDDEFDDDNKTSDSVSALHGWTGAKYQDKTGSKVNGEGYLYTKLGEEKKGLKFGTVTGATDVNDYQYRVTPVTGTTKFGVTIVLGTTTIADSGTAANNAPSRISIDGFDITAGYKVYEAKDGETTVMIPGSYHGVPGDYRCTVSSAGGDCRVNYNEKGQTFSTDAADDSDTTGVEFIPDSAETQVTAEDAEPLAEYGWWLKKSDADDWTVNVFASQHSSRTGDDDLAIGTTANLATSGTAKYVGGAAGKYAFSSRLGDSHDAGHFTAKVTLDAKFGDADSGDTISGTVNGFTGDADGMEDWSVKLGTSRIGEHFEDDSGTIGLTSGSDNGEIPGFTGGTSATASTRSEVTWSLHDDDDNASAGGQWQGQLWDLENSVPTVATGTFRATYGSDATMAGAFGADKE